VQLKEEERLSSCTVFYYENGEVNYIMKMG